MIFARKMPEFYTLIARKYFFLNFGGHVPPSAPVSYACEAFDALTWLNTTSTVESVEG